jgi:hypothetical protein
MKSTTHADFHYAIFCILRIMLLRCPGIRNRMDRQSCADARTMDSHVYTTVDTLCICFDACPEARVSLDLRRRQFSPCILSPGSFLSFGFCYTGIDRRHILLPYTTRTASSLNMFLRLGNRRVYTHPGPRSANAHTRHMTVVHPQHCTHNTFACVSRVVTKPGQK